MSLNAKEQTDAYLSLETENVICPQYFLQEWLFYIFVDCSISLQIAGEKLPILDHMYVTLQKNPMNAGNKQ